MQERFTFSLGCPPLQSMMAFDPNTTLQAAHLGSICMSFPSVKRRMELSGIGSSVLKSVPYLQNASSGLFVWRKTKVRLLMSLHAVCLHCFVMAENLTCYTPHSLRANEEWRIVSPRHRSHRGYKGFGLCQYNFTRRIMSALRK